jgi:ADP-ribose pyrophosphatase YjhB (NUDIX family)
LEPRRLEDRDLEACPRCDFVLWHDPKVVTIVVVENDRGEVVAGRRGIEPGYGLWCLPGGFVNDDEHPAEAAARECREEICVEVEIVGLLGVYHIRKRDAPSMVGIAYHARLLSGAAPAAGSEMLEVTSFPRHRVPELAFSSHMQAMHDWLANGEESGAERL